ncbi:hypothetical protein GW17_00033033 [Ensete ventricosum]|nr:hypothetical protein GW17_00033033 [Ensete ventricosum]
MIGYLALGSSDGAGELSNCPAEATIEGLMMAPHSANVALGLAARRARDLEETKEEASGVPKAPVAGSVPATELVMEELNVGVLFAKAEVSSRLGPTRMCGSINVALMVKPRLGVHFVGCLSP